MARTQEERKAETRARLIAAAADLFARKGFHAVSAEAVADAADRTTGALYSHFGGKDGLLLALVEQWLEESAARILLRVQGGAPPDAPAPAPRTRLNPVSHSTPSTSSRTRGRALCHTTSSTCCVERHLCSGMSTRTQRASGPSPGTPTSRRSAAMPRRSRPRSGRRSSSTRTRWPSSSIG